MRLKFASKPLMALLMAGVLIAGCQTVQPPSASETPKTQEGNKPPSGNQTEPSKEPATGTSKGDAKETPRNETLYVNGLQWGAPTNFNLLSGNPAFPINYGNSRELVYETLFMINQLDGALEPLLGTKYEWKDDTLHVELNEDAKWNDGKPFTSEDVVYTYELGKKYDINWSSYWTNISEVTADGANAVNIKLNKDNPN